MVSVQNWSVLPTLATQWHWWQDITIRYSYGRGMHLSIQYTLWSRDVATQPHCWCAAGWAWSKSLWALVSAGLENATHILYTQMKQCLARKTFTELLKCFIYLKIRLNTLLTCVISCHDCVTIQVLRNGRQEWAPVCVLVVCAVQVCMCLPCVWLRTDTIWRMELRASYCL